MPLAIACLRRFYQETTTMQRNTLATPSVIALAALLALGLAACNGGAEPAGDVAATTPAEVADRPGESTTAFPTDGPEVVDLVDSEDPVALVAAELAARERELALREAAVAASETRAARASRPQPAPATWEPVAEPAAAPAPAPSVAPAPPPQPRRVSVHVPAGTALAVELVDGLSSETSEAGDFVEARLLDEVWADGRRALPAGTRLYGTVTEAQGLRRVGGRARLAVRFDRLELPDGSSAPASAGFAEEGRSETVRDAATIGGATAGGAILGRVVDRDHKKKATAIGAVVGAAVGTVVAARTQGEVIELLAGSTLRLTLEGGTTVEVAG
ncbi:MAG TPA: TrbI/VirB10 family protein [Thermoanaerobaculia bacterium]|nr:TrbI/VirB10 family protein [Thermoanaerobaculia bacterium]